MIQQKKVNTIFSLNYFDPYKSSQTGKKSHKYKHTDQQERRKCSKSQLSNANIINQTVNNQNRQGLNDKQKSLNQLNLSQKPDGRQRANIQNDKIKRKTSKNYNLNLSSSAVILSHTKEKQSKINSRDKKKSFLKLQVSHLNQQQGKNPQEVEQKTLKSQKQPKFIPQGRKPREQATKPSFYSLKKDKRSDRLQQYQRKKHLSVVSMLQGNVKSNSKSRSKSKSKSKSKDKKAKKKNSYKFKKISFVNKENQFCKANFNVQSIQKEFKSITKKLQKQFEIKPKKSTKSTQKIDKDTTQYVDRKKSKIFNKENREPTKKHLKTNIIRLEEAIEPNIVIKKQSLHAHRKHSQKFQLNIKPSQKKRSKQKQKLQNSHIYFFIKKNETPSSSRKQFPINKYLQISKPIDTQQNKRNSFQKTVKPTRKRASLNEKQISSHRSSSKDHYLSLIDQTRIQSSIKTKVKKPSKHKKQGNVSCLYLLAQNIQKDGLKRRSQSLSDQELIYRQSGEQFRERIHFDSRTSKQDKLEKEDINQTVMRRKKATYSNQQQETFSQIKKISRTLKQNEKGPNEETLVVYESQTFNHSLDINQIRYYEGITPSNQQQRNIKSSSNTIIITGHQTYPHQQEPRIFQKQFRNRQLIVSELKEEYPLLNKKELQFLASVCFIQRKWKQIILARKINNLISLKNTSELFVKNKTASFRPNLYTEEKSSSNFMTSVVISKSQMKNLTTQSQNTQTEQFLSLQTQQHIHEVFFKKQNQLFYDKNIQKPQTEQQKNQEKQPIFQVQNQEQQQKQMQVSRNVPFKQEDIFPDLSYLKTKKYLEKKKLFQRISQLNDSFKQHQISHEECESRKRDLEAAYKKEVRQIHDAKKALKKGYLMYIQTLNTVNKSLIKEQKSMRSSRKNGSSKLLKRVNSEEGVLGDIYRKIFKLDQLSSDNGSEQSGETKRLNDMFLIRKIALSNQNQKQFRKFNGLGLNMGIHQQDNLIYTQRGQGKQKTEEDQANVMPLSTRQVKSMQFGESREVNLELDTNIIIEEQILVSVQQQQSQANKVEEKEQNEVQLQKKIESQQSYQLVKSQNFKTYNISQLLLSPEELNSLGESPIRNLYIKQQHSPEQLLGQPSPKQDDHKHKITVKEQKEFRTDQEIKKALQPQSGDDQIDNICFSLEHNHEEYNDQMPAYVSPVSSTITISNGANAESREYLASFVHFLKQSDYWTQTICSALNSPQGFTAYAYLKFVRQFELPEGQYTQIIPNQAFIEWEKLNQSQGEQTKGIKSSQSLIFQDDSCHSFSITHCKSIQHRCLYELLNSELQSSRVYGEKGRPFPWQVSYSCYDPAIIEREKVGQILDKCLEKCIYNVLSFACGIVLENHPDILNEEDLQQLHDKNEDSIIDMIEGQLVHQKHAWYQLQEHTLETNFEVSELIWNDMVHQFSMEMLKLKNPKGFTS